jgi:hypothetical protein
MLFTDLEARFAVSGGRLNHLCLILERGIGGVRVPGSIDLISGWERQDRPPCSNVYQLLV